MASLRKSTIPNDGTTAKFLYTILKQLDHKSIDWAEVASELDITNGHAARMRFSRFRQHMEGVAPTTRKPRDSHLQKKIKLEKRRKAAEVRGSEEDRIPIKSDPDVQLSFGDIGDVTTNESQAHIETVPGMQLEGNYAIKPDPDAELGPGNMDMFAPHIQIKSELDIKMEPDMLADEVGYWGVPMEQEMEVAQQPPEW